MSALIFVVIIPKSHNTSSPHLGGIAGYFAHDADERLAIVACLHRGDLIQKGVDRLIGGFGLLFGHDSSLNQFNKKEFLLLEKLLFCESLNQSVTRVTVSCHLPIACET
jgi:hypothetical protein